MPRIVNNSPAATATPGVTKTPLPNRQPLLSPPTAAPAKQLAPNFLPNHRPPPPAETKRLPTHQLTRASCYHWASLVCLPTANSKDRAATPFHPPTTKAPSQQTWISPPPPLLLPATPCPPRPVGRPHRGALRASRSPLGPPQWAPASGPRGDQGRPGPLSQGPPAAPPRLPQHPRDPPGENQGPQRK